MNLIKRVEQWHIEKFGEDGPAEQPAWEKVMEELGELKYDREKASKKKVCEEATDVIITLIGYIHAISPANISVAEVIEEKLEVIERRDGEVIDGKFVKEDDS